MAEDRIAVLAERLAAVERAVAELRAKNPTSNGKPFVSTKPNDPLDGHPLISKGLPPEEAAALDAQIDRELGIEGIEPVGPEKLREMMIADGIDPNDNEFSRGIIEERDERMIFGYLDSSSLAKRYVPEPGSLVVDHLFAKFPPGRLIVLSVGMAEVVSILVRKHNSQRITTATFRRALTEFRKEFRLRSPIRVIDVTGTIAVRAYRFIEHHSINSTDAILLCSALDLAVPLRAAGDESCLFRRTDGC